MREWWVGLLALSLLLAQFSVAGETDIEESVDLTSLGRARTSVVFHLRDGRTRDRESLEAACRRIPQALSCIPNVVTMPEGEDVIFDIDALHDLSIQSIEGEGPDRLVFLSRIRPLQFSLGTGFGEMSRILLVRYPSHTTAVERVQDAVLTATIPLDLTTAEELDIQAPDPVPAGELVRLPGLEGALCVLAVLDDTTIVERRLLPGCQNTLIPTVGLDPDNEHRLLVVVVDIGAIKRAVVPITIRPVEFHLSMLLDRDPVVAGESFTIELGRRVESCVVTLEDAGGHVMDRLELTECERIPVGTSSGMVPGMYIVRVDATIGGRMVSVATTIEILSSGMETAVIHMEKRSFLPGEKARIHVDTPGDWCTTAVYNLDGIKVSEEATFGCGTFDIQLDDALPPGKYIIRTEVFKKGVLTAVVATPIEVKEWRPAMRTARHELCAQGFLPVDELRIPCIAEGDVCSPSSLATPFCLCFADDEATDVCRYGSPCTADGCGPRKLADPYVIVREPGGRCIARRGSDSLSCVEEGELCTDRCVCLSGSGSPVATCSQGESCQPDGCQATNLQFRIKELPVNHTRTDVLAKGVTLTWKGSVLFDGSPVVTQGAVTGKAFLSDLRSSGFEALFDGSWSLTATFAGDLSPGTHELYLVVEHNGFRHVIRSPFEVWYPQDDSGIILFMERMSPTQLSRAELGIGSPLELMVRVRDLEGRDLVHLPQRAFTLTAAGLMADPVTATYDHVGGIWTVVGSLRGIPNDKDGSVLSVEHLGRKGTLRAQLSVADRAPLSLRIQRVEPGTMDKPLFYVLTTLGFELDIYLRIHGAEGITKESFDIRLGELAIRPDMITYIINTLEGTRIHISGVRLCPPEPPDTLLPLVVNLADSGRSAHDSTTVLIKGNPGHWDNVEEVSC
ncbi:MAG: hypothetical protein QF415_01315 [Candidatus Undinarchaeales archaeon]|nr:hypothetical protein [Candidatus Undinarchaeales archaeon]MDP7493291.1 hypothetical protein [Candidatus Undinarchaeales archaeon]